MTSLDFVVTFTDKTFSFHIELDMLSVDYIRRLIADHFCIDMDEFLLEIFDQRFNEYIILDEVYINELQPNLYSKTITSHRTRIRSRHENLDNNQLNTNTLESRSFEKIEQSCDQIPSRPDHLIIWLDAYISHPQNNRELKRYFNAATSVDMDIRLSPTFDIDIDNLIRIPDFVSINNYPFNDERNILHMFSNVTDCVKFINASSNSNVTLFVISSGPLGRKLMPQVIHDPRIYAIYIFTCNISAQIDWALNYIDKVVMFDHELDLLSRLTRDIAEYYVRKALATIENTQQSLNYLNWAKKLLNNADIVDRQSYSKEKLKQIESFIEEVEMYSRDEPKHNQATTFHNRMDGQNPKENVSASRINASTTAASSTINNTRQHIVQNSVLIWIDANIAESAKDCQNTLVQLRSIVNDVKIFTDPDQCVDFLTDIEQDMKAFLITGDTLGQQIIHLIYDIHQLDTIYIYCSDTSQHEDWTKKWAKIKRVHTDTAPICESLQQLVKQDNEDSIAVSFVATDKGTFNQNLNQLDPSFMYVQIFKEILLEMKHNQHSIEDFITYCRNSDYGSSYDITRFENEYNAQSAIWWYTYPSFIYSLLNNALHMLKYDTIIMMGFFIHDLHQQIEQLHQKQVSDYNGKTVIVYRGQHLSTDDFEKLQKTKGGLMSFNSFLSTSKIREVSLGFAKGALGKTDTVGILFEITIDPLVSSAPFATTDDVSYFQTEEEILFSMHTVFRIEEIKQVDKNNPLYQVELELTADDEEQLRTLTEYIREEASDSGWQRMGTLLFKIGQFNKAEELYKVLLEQTSDESDKALYYNQLGYAKYHQGDYEKAFRCYEKATQLYHKIVPPNHPSLATCYNNIGGVYMNIGEYSKAVAFYEKALEISQKTLPSNHPGLGTSYNNIGMVYKNMGEYSKALSLYEKALEIRQKAFPPNHPDFAQSYNNIGAVYMNMGEYLKALSFYQKALEIRQKALPSNHPDLATSYNNIGAMFKNIGEYSKALSFYEKALEISQKTLPSNHPSLGTSYNNIGVVYKNMGEYSKALSLHEKALEIRQKALPSSHPDLATFNNNIGAVYMNMGEYSKALSFYEKALQIYQKTLPPNHPSLATSYNNIGWVFRSMKNYSKALSYFERALDVKQRSLPPNHPSIQKMRGSIEIVKKKL